MVSVRRNQGRQPSVVTPFLFIVMVVISIIFFMGGSNLDVYSGNLLAVENIQGSSSLDPNTLAMRNWRRQLESACQSFLDGMDGNITESHLETKERLEAEALKLIDIPDNSSVPASSHRPPYRFCKHVFVDLGTNRGDSIGYAVDAALDVCSPLFLQKDPTITKAYRISPKFPHFHFDVNDLRVYGKGYPAFSLLYLLQKYFRPTGGMANTCVYGMEGNPYFTKHLRQLEDFIYAMKPRPLQHLHIHTESVVAPTDGPTTLYIDQFSAKDHVSRTKPSFLPSHSVMGNTCLLTSVIVISTTSTTTTTTTSSGGLVFFRACRMFEEQQDKTMGRL
jgi:hypothetical protein